VPTETKYQNQTDAQIIAACLVGDAQAWDDLLVRYGRLIFSIARRMNLSVTDAEDVYQNVCILLLENLHQLRDPQRIAGWLALTTRREALRYKNRHRPTADWEEIHETTLTDEAPLPEAQVLAIADRNLIERGMTTLSEKCQQLLHSLYLAEPPLSYEEITQRHAIPLGSIGPNRSRCLESLRKALQQLGF
jgi:RNA polymerase sigma factor (sigma-70 family)